MGLRPIGSNKTQNEREITITQQHKRKEKEHNITTETKHEQPRRNTRAQHLILIKCFKVRSLVFTYLMFQI